MHDIPSNLKFSKTHVWLEDLGENNYRVGITDFAQDQLGDIVFLELSPQKKGVNIIRQMNVLLLNQLNQLPIFIVH